MPPSLCLVVLRSADLDRSERFYRALGFEFRRVTVGWFEHQSS
jgi:catechol 2,3-dioxygenase-like lactoylglutathione lyase family enzyme